MLQEFGGSEPPGNTVLNTGIPSRRRLRDFEGWGTGDPGRERDQTVCSRDFQEMGLGDSGMGFPLFIPISFIISISPFTQIECVNGLRDFPSAQREAIVRWQKIDETQPSG